MMRFTRNTINVLIGALAAQAVLAALLLVPRDQADDPLVTFDFETVDEIRVSGNEDEAISLASQAGAWTMSGDLPVDASRIESLNEVFVGDRWTWPVASTSDAAKRFEVAEDKFQRRIELLADDEQVATLYLGTSPGFRRIHAREADSENIYSIELATYDLPLDTDDWLDKSLIEAPASIESMSRPGLWSAELDGEGEWAISDSSLIAKSSELASMATRLETLRVMGIADAVPEHGPDLEFEITAAGVDVRYAFYRPPEEVEEGDAEAEAAFSASVRDTLVKSSLRDEYFRVSSFTVDQLDKTLADLIDAAAEDADTGH